MRDVYINQDALSKINLHEGILIRQFEESDFAAIQKLYADEGWMTPTNRPEDAMKAWKNSPIALVAVNGDIITGLVRALTDGELTTYIAELLVSKNYRGAGLGKSLIDTCHYLFPNTRIDLLSTESADEFYNRNKFREIKGFRKSY